VGGERNMYKDKKKMFLPLLFILLLLVLAGCWSSKPIEDLNIIAGTSLDKAEKGRLKSEYWNPYLKPAFNNKNLKDLEKKAEKEVKRMVENVTKKMQDEFKVEVAGFGNQLRIEYPKLWEKVKKDWDKEFSTIPVNYHVDITIKDYGNIGAKKGMK
jgi:hypothetical protein